MEITHDRGKTVRATDQILTSLITSCFTLRIYNQIQSSLKHSLCHFLGWRISFIWKIPCSLAIIRPYACYPRNKIYPPCLYNAAQQYQQGDVLEEVGNLTQQLTDWTETVSGWISVPLLFILLGTGFFVSFSLRWIQVRKLKHSFDVVGGKYDNPADEGDITHFQALSAALSATIGIGNIAGVALALRLGGPGALFWMWLTALLGMALKYAECTLSHRFRTIHEDGSASGGPMYYIERGLGPAWKPLAVSFAVLATLCSFCTGNMNQANTIAQTVGTYGVPYWATGLLIATLVGLVIIGGIRRIAAVASRLVPTMAILYVGGALLIIATHLENFMPALSSIFREAFSLKAGWGSLFIVIMWGVRRGLYSNEAGQGSAPIAHAAAKTKESVREGAVALMGPFIDTLCICSMTGLAILTTGVLNTTDLTGAELTREAFRTGFGFAPRIGSALVNGSV
ncbi:MAG: sodium:alanine symporter family protein, partial [Fidelibacterota bacterium]